MKAVITAISVKKLFLLLFLFLAFNFSANCQNLKKTVRIKFNTSQSARLSELESKQVQKTNSGFVKTGISNFDALTTKYQVVAMKRVFRPAGKFEARHKKYGLHLWYELEVNNSENADIAQAVKDFKSADGVAVVEEIYEKTLYDVENQSGTPVQSFVSNDPSFSQQWHYNNAGQTGGTRGSDIKLVSAWDIQKGSNNVIVAVIDGGVDRTHQDLNAAMWVNKAEKNGITGVDDDNNGFIDDINGYGFGDNTGNFSAEDHGTHVAGTIGAITNNGIGVSGIAGGSGSGDGVRIMSCATFGSYNNGGFDEAFIYAADNGAVIAQNSWGYTYSGNYEQSVLDAIDYFIANAGKDENGNQTGPIAGGIVIFAAGNDNSESRHYPGYYEPVLAVASINHNSAKAYYSNYGIWVDVAAPGGETNASTNQGVLSTLKGNSYGYYQGTSMACPHVSGLAALIVSQFAGPGVTSQLVWDRIVSRTDNINSINPSYSCKLGSGRINAYRSLIIEDSIPPSAVNDLSIMDTSSSSVTISWSASGSSGSTGKATLYEIRFAQFALNETNFSTATLCLNPPKPKLTGETELFELKGLIPETEYYVALKVVDLDGAVSDISNFIHVRTLPAPVISVLHDSLYITVNAGDSLVRNFTIDNVEGHNTLNYTIGIKYIQDFNTSPTRDRSKDIVYTDLKPEETFIGINAPVSPIVTVRKSEPYFEGFESDSLTDWYTDNYSGVNEVVNSTSASGQNSLHIKSLYRGHFTGIHQDFLDSTRPGYICFNIRTSCAATSDGYLVVASDDYDHIFFFTSKTGKFYLNYDVGGDYSFSYKVNQWYFIEFKDIDWENKVFDYYVNDKLIKADIPMRYPSYSNNGFTRLYLYNFDYNSEAWWDNINIGNRHQTWLSTDIQTGSVSAGNSQDVQVSFNSKNIPYGTFNANINIQSNDPFSPNVIIPAKMHIKGSPVISINTDILRFGQTYTGFADTLKLSVINTGTDLLTIDSVYTTNSCFGVSPENLSVNFGKRTELKVWYKAREVRVDTSLLFIVSNDSVNPVKSVVLIGESVLPPVISVVPDSFYVQLFTDDTIVTKLTVDNTKGGSLLNATLEVEPDLIKSALDSTTYIKGSEVLVIEDYYFRLKIPTFITNEFGIIPDVITSANIGNTDFSPYKVIIITGYQYGTFYSNLNNQLSKFEKYVRSGGIIIYQAATRGSNLTIVDSVLIKYGNQEFNNFNNKPDHPILKGLPEILSFERSGSADSVIQDKPEPEPTYYVNNCYFDTLTLPANYKLLTSTYSSELPTTIEYKYGAGTVIATGMMWEYMKYYSYTPGKMLYNSINYAFNLAGTKWLQPEVFETKILSGESDDINMNFNAGGYFGGDYYANIKMNNNDPANSAITIPVHMHVIGRPVLNINTDSLLFGKTYTGYYDTLKVTIRNTGTDRLIIDSIYTTDSHFSVSQAKINLDYGKSAELVVRYNANEIKTDEGLLYLVSNDTANSPLQIFLKGESILAPIITVRPDSFYVELNVGDTLVKTMEIGNVGGNELNYRIITNLPDSLNLSSLTERLNKIGATKIKFSEGMLTYEISGTSEIDGQVKEFTVSQTTGLSAELKDIKILFTNSYRSVFQVELEARGAKTFVYSNVLTDQILDSINILIIDDYLYPTADEISIINNWVRNGGSLLIDDDAYIIEKNQIMQGSGISYQDFSCINGLTSDISGHEVTEGIREYLIAHSFSSIQVSDRASDVIRDEHGIPYCAVAELGAGRVMAVGDESVYGSYANLTGHLNLGLNGITWLARRGWLKVQMHEGSIAVNSSMTMQVLFDAKTLFGGEYRKNIKIVSNDPADTTVVIPARLLVTGIPVLNVVDDSVDFGKIFQGYSDTLTLTIQNTGTDYLKIDTIYTTDSHFGITPGNLNLKYFESAELTVWYKAGEVQTNEGKVIIVSNDSTSSPATILLHGESIYPPVMEVYPAVLYDTLEAGYIDNKILTIHNAGRGLLNYNLANILSAANYRSEEIHENYNTVLVELGKDEIDTRVGDIVTSRSGGRDVFGHTWIDSDENGGPVFNWVDISSTGTMVSGLSDDNYVGPFPIGFEFPFYENTYQSFYIQSNGLIYFSNPGSSYTNQLIPTKDGINNFIAWCWDDLYPNGSVYYKDFGDKIIIQFKNYGEFGGSGRINAEIILFRNGNISFQYQNTLNGFDTRSCSVGIENSIGTDGLQVAFNTSYIHDSLVLCFINEPDWLNYTDSVGTINPDSSVYIDIQFDGTELVGGDYSSQITITSNDPALARIDIPVYLHVDAKPLLTVQSDSILFGQLFTGRTDTLTFTISNQGKEKLEIEHIYVTNRHFGISHNSFEIPIDRSVELKVWYNAREIQIDLGWIYFFSNDTRNTPKAVFLKGQSVFPPSISVSPDSIYKRMYMGQELTEPFKIYNHGGSNLNLKISIVPQISATSSKHVLSGAKLNYTKTTNGNSAYDKSFVYPTESILAFDEGTEGLRLSNYMLWSNYGGGHLVCNVFSDDDYIYFQQPVELFFFEMCGLPNDINNNYPTGRIRVNGYNSQQRIVWTSLVDLSQTNSWEIKTRVDVNTKDISYLEFKAVNFYPSIDNLHVMNSATWLAVDPVSVTIPAGRNLDIGAYFNTNEIDTGDFFANIVIKSNDPVNSTTVIPAHLRVDGCSHLSISANSMDFGQLFPDDSDTMTLALINKGNQLLLIDSIFTDNENFSVDIKQLYLNRNERANIDIIYNPNEIGVDKGNLFIISNDIINRVTVVALTGELVKPPLLSVEPGSVNVELHPGQQYSQAFSIVNLGKSTLKYYISIHDTISGTSMPWLGINSYEDAIAPDSSKELSIYIDGRYLELGDYYKQLIITSNDPANLKIVVPVKIHITNVPNIIYTVACDSYTSPSGNYVWTSSGFYSDTVYHDISYTVYSVNLTINKANTTVILNKNQLKAYAFNEDYQWIDCNNGHKPIIGENDQTFTATKSGYYAVIVAKNGCTDTSECVLVNTTDIPPNPSEVNIIIYPNPTDGRFTIDFGRIFEDAVITITELDGRLVQIKQVERSQITNIDLASHAGIYLMTITADSEREVFRIIKN